ncbi:MAG: HesA/MoeB/ThiF family protein [Candidatus Margulisbacteria bacterium]|nr:HesA/MoeB/ThiF family protein [Candidatus Margulisiibacteriota bacterium]
MSGSCENEGRYSRQLILQEIGEAGQEKLRQGRVLVVGAGGLGSPALLYLAAAGVGHIGIVDSDFIELSNLNRQTLYATEDVGKLKAQVAAHHIKALNPDCEILAFSSRLTADNADRIVKDYQIIIDGSDNFATRYILNDVCVKQAKTLIYGAVYQFEGQLMIIRPGEGACFRCLFNEEPPPGEVPACRENGVIGFLPGLVGTWQAAEAIKQVLGIGETGSGELMVLSPLERSWRKVNVARDRKCPVCKGIPKVVG